MRHFLTRHDAPDPLERYEAFQERVISDDAGDDPDFDDEFVVCDWCDHRATMADPHGWPICEDCAEERASGRDAFGFIDNQLPRDR